MKPGDQVKIKRRTWNGGAYVEQEEHATVVEAQKGKRLKVRLRNGDVITRREKDVIA